MLGQKENITKYLQDYHAGKIKKGLDIGLPIFDDEIRFKQGQFNIINGLDNVGKTIFMLWYFLCLSVKHDLKWCIYSGENQSGQLVRQLIQFYTGKKIQEMKLSEVFKYEIEIGNWFDFIDNRNFYKSKDLFKVFNEKKYNGCLIDPYTGLDRKFTHEGNYDFLNECRQFCNTTGKSIYVNTHVVSEAARKIYSDKHDYAGYAYPPSKSDSEGGQPFGNRCDDFITIHRLLGHSTMKYKTLFYVRKVKDTETGGQVTDINDPLELEFNSGLGFTLNGFNPLNNSVVDDMAMKPLNINSNFEKEVDKLYNEPENPPF